MPFDFLSLQKKITFNFLKKGFKILPKNHTEKILNDIITKMIDFSELHL